jgi:hypothetical protein
MFWGCIIFDGVGTLTEIEGNMNTTKYLETLGDISLFHWTALREA